MQDFRNLKVWDKAHQLTLAVYQATAKFPSDELFGLRTKILRGFTSIAAKIAEACGRGGDVDFARCLCLAMGYACELEYHLLARDLGFLASDRYKALDRDLVGVKRMLISL